MADILYDLTNIEHCKVKEEIDRRKKYINSDGWGAKDVDSLFVLLFTYTWNELNIESKLGCWMKESSVKGILETINNYKYFPKIVLTNSSDREKEQFLDELKINQPITILDQDQTNKEAELYKAAFECLVLENIDGIGCAGYFSETEKCDCPDSCVECWLEYALKKVREELNDDKKNTQN